MSDDNDKKTGASDKKVGVIPKAKPSEKADIAAKNTDKQKTGDYVLREGHTWANAWKLAAGVGVLGLALSAAGFMSDPRRFAFSYLFAFMAVLTPALGTLFFVLQQHLTSSGWSVTIRRTAELFASGLVVFAILFAPIWVMRAKLFPWVEGAEQAETHPEAAATHTTAADLSGRESGLLATSGRESGLLAEAQPATGQEETPAERRENHESGPQMVGPGMEHGRHGEHGPGAHEPVMNASERGEHGDPEEVEAEHTLRLKRGYLNDGFFGIRAVIYLAIWAWLGFTFLGRSTKQDTTKDPKITVGLRRFSCGAVYLFGFTLTFAAFDWVMSLEPLWYSTIFGVYVFAGCAVSAYALLILVTMGIRSSGVLVKEINVEHYHDMGKLMFGFVVFWAYIGFAQFMLIWYAAIPEEVQFFHLRWDHGPWATVSLALVGLNFIVPFFLIISRNVKRRLGLLAFGSAWLLIMHFVDIYWLVMPNFGQDGFNVSWIDLVCLLGVGGVYFAVVLYRMSTTPLIPIGDPRLQRALQFENM
ncbi:MAG: hypothetical protein ACRELY_20660 [Polyangiaceae bacterium]